MSVWKAMPAMSDYCLEPFFVYWRRLRAFGIRTVIFFLGQRRGKDLRLCVIYDCRKINARYHQRKMNTMYKHL